MVVLPVTSSFALILLLLSHHFRTFQSFGTTPYLVTGQKNRPLICSKYSQMSYSCTFAMKLCDWLLESDVIILVHE